MFFAFFAQFFACLCFGTAVTALRGVAFGHHFAGLGATRGFSGHMRAAILKEFARGARLIVRRAEKTPSEPDPARTGVGNAIRLFIWLVRSRSPVCVGNPQLGRSLP